MKTWVGQELIHYCSRDEMRSGGLANAVETLSLAFLPAARDGQRARMPGLAEVVESEIGRRCKLYCDEMLGKPILKEPPQAPQPEPAPQAGPQPADTGVVAVPRESLVTNLTDYEKVRGQAVPNPLPPAPIPDRPRSPSGIGFALSPSEIEAIRGEEAARRKAATAKPEEEQTTNG